MKLTIITEPLAGGVGEYFCNHLSCLIHDPNIQYEFIYSDHRADPEKITRLRNLSNGLIKFKRFYTTNKLSIVVDLFWCYRFYRYLKDNAPQVVHFNSSKVGILGRLVCILSNYKGRIIYTPHGLPLNKSIIYKYLERLLAYKTDLFNFVSKSESHNAINYLKICKQKTIVTPLFLSKKLKFAMPKDLNSENITLYTVGRVTIDKDPEFFIKCVLSLSRSHNKFNFKWIGSFENEKYKPLFKKSVPFCNITGWVDDVYETLSGKAIMVMTSKNESFCYAAAEAISLGIPTILRRSIGLTDLLPQDYKYYFSTLQEFSIIADSIANDYVKSLHYMSEYQHYFNKTFTKTKYSKLVKKMYGFQTNTE